LRDVVAFGLDRIDPERDIRIVLVEGADRVLPALPEHISKVAIRLLERRLRGQPLLPCAYRGFGSLVSLGSHTTIGRWVSFLAVACSSKVSSPG
jgi:NADH dehydrogenase FAD-containing subunit